MYYEKMFKKNCKKKKSKCRTWHLLSVLTNSHTSVVLKKKGVSMFENKKDMNFVFKMNSLNLKLKKLPKKKIRIHVG